MTENQKHGLFRRLLRGRRPDAEPKVDTPRIDDNDPTVLNVIPGRPVVSAPPAPELGPVDRRDHMARGRSRDAVTRQKPHVDDPGVVEVPDQGGRPSGSGPSLAPGFPDRRETPREETAETVPDESHARDVREDPEAVEARIEEIAAGPTDWRVMFGERESPDHFADPLTSDEETHRHADVAVEPAGIASDKETDAGDVGGVPAEPDYPLGLDPTHQDVHADEMPAGEPGRIGWLGRLRQGLARTSSRLAGNISSIFTRRKLDDETIEELEDLLIQSDLGIDAAMQVTEALARGRYNKEVSDTDVKEVLAAEVERLLDPVARPLVLTSEHRPEVILMVGVNGSGKTTTIGKLAQKFGAEGRKVMLAAGDTFRAAASEQLKIWGERTGAPVISRGTGADAAGLVFDAMVQAKAEGSDVLMIDTAGRLQNKAELMAELKKVVRVIRKHDPSAPHHVLLTVDATTGQNALNQVDVFGRSVGVTGIVMTKLDGTARGGILVAIAEKHALPVHFIGVGETADDLQPFEARDFARAIAGMDQ